MGDTIGPTMGSSVISKVVTILRRLEDSGALTITEIAHTTGIPLSTAHRIIGELAAWQVLHRGADGRYELAPVIGEPARVRRPSPQTLLTRAAATLVDLSSATRHDVRLGYLQGARVWYAEQAHGPQPLARFTPAATLPAHATAIGQVLLAYSPPALVTDVMNCGLARYTPSTPTDAKALGRALAAIRLRGIAVVSGQLSSNHAAVAAPVFGPGRKIVAALEVRLQNVLGELRGVVPALEVAARSMSRELADVPLDDSDAISSDPVDTAVVSAAALRPGAMVV